MSLYYDKGRQAFAAGADRIVPHEVLIVGGPDGARDWYRGWDQANLEAPVWEEDPDYPDHHSAEHELGWLCVLPTDDGNWVGVVEIEHRSFGQPPGTNVTEVPVEGVFVVLEEAKAAVRVKATEILEAEAEAERQVEEEIARLAEPEEPLDEPAGSQFPQRSTWTP